jgi:hypothetical protein
MLTPLAFYQLRCSGLLPSLVGVAHVAIQFPLYEALKSHIAEDGKQLTPLQLVSHLSFPFIFLIYAK